MGMKYGENRKPPIDGCQPTAGKSAGKYRSESNPLAWAGGNIQAPVGANAANPLGTAGQITTTATMARQIQFALKVIF